MLLLAAGRLRSYEPGGDMRLGLAIAVLGLATNAWYWRRFGALARERPDALIDAQRRLYRAKVTVDACVIAALTAGAGPRLRQPPPRPVGATATRDRPDEPPASSRPRIGTEPAPP